MSFDNNAIQSAGDLISKNPKNSAFDWFVIGILYGHPNNTKTLKELFNNVNNITSLARDGAMSTDDTNDFLKRMVNNLLGQQNVKRGDSGQNDVFAQGEKKNGISDKQPIRKSSTIDLDAASDKTAGLADDFSFKSDNELTPTKATRKKSSDGLKELDEFSDLIERENKKKVVITKPPSPKTTEQRYVRKPADQVNTSIPLHTHPLKRTTTAEEERLSMQLIKELEEEERRMLQETQERKQKEDQQMNDINCSICLCSLMDEDFIPLEACEHMFHTGCFGEFLKSEINSRSFPIKCPSNCGTELAQNDIVHSLDAEFEKKFYDYSLQSYVNANSDQISCCPTPNCEYAFVQDEEKDGDDENVLQCPICKKTYCLNCRVDFHKGMTCKEFQISGRRDENDIKFEKFVKGKKFKQCSKCKFWVEKNKGCDHMTCRCKYEFCYKCGGKYRECDCVKKMQEKMQARQLQMQARMQKRAAPAASASKRRRR